MAKNYRKKTFSGQADSPDSLIMTGYNAKLRAQSTVSAPSLAVVAL
jgi:hypothetical protein